MESLLDRNMSGSNYSSPLITDDILSILENDPFWRDLEMNGGLMNEPFDLSQCLESENGTNDLDLVLENDLSFSKTQTMDFTNNELPPIEHPDTDSASHYSESSHSPRSSSSGSDNAESSVVIQPFTPEYSDHDLYSVPQVYCDNSNSNSPQTAIDIGADVVVVTSEYSPLDESSHTIVTLPPQQIIKSSAKAGREGKKRKVEDDDDLSFFGTISQDLNLTEDEVKLMKKEGLNIPNHFPLTKAEEKELKRIRRKIRNKHSAQESRKRKKEYVDGLENRVKVCTSENVRLQKKVQLLENQQKSLLDQIKSLQAMISGSSAKPAPTSTCLLVLFASLLLFLLPSLFPSTTYEPKSLVSNGKSSDVTPGASRVLLSAKEVDSGQLEKGIAEDLINKSNEQYVTTVKSEFPQDSYGEPFHSYPTIAELTSHQYNPSKDYTWHSPGYQRDEAGFIVQNESKYFDAGDSPRVKRKLMLQ